MMPSPIQEFLSHLRMVTAILSALLSTKVVKVDLIRVHVKVPHYNVDRVILFVEVTCSRLLQDGAIHHPTTCIHQLTLA